MRYIHTSAVILTHARNCRYIAMCKTVVGALGFRPSVYRLDRLYCTAVRPSATRARINMMLHAMTATRGKL